MAGTDADVIDSLVGIAPGSPLDAIRARRPQARIHAQATYRALFEPASPGRFIAQERFAVGAFVAGLHGDVEIADHFAGRLVASGAPRRTGRRSVPPLRRPRPPAPTAATRRGR